MNLVGGCKWLMGATCFEWTNSVFKVTDETNTFLKTLPCNWNIKKAEKSIAELNKILELRSQNDIELHVEQVEKKG